jgi:hypothetical protein
MPAGSATFAPSIARCSLCLQETVVSFNLNTYTFHSARLRWANHATHVLFCQARDGLNTNLIKGYRKNAGKCAAVFRFVGRGAGEIEQHGTTKNYNKNTIVINQKLPSRW